jgi:hypothetical protein
MKRLILLTCLLTTPILGQTFEENLYKQHGEHKIFYSAFGSLFIDPKIAVANNIVRGKGKGLVNIAMVKQLGVGVPGTVTGTVSNILQQTQTLEFVAVREKNTVYHLAPFKFDNEDFLTFKIDVKPLTDPSGYSYNFKFQKKMYHN